MKVARMIGAVAVGAIVAVGPALVATAAPAVVQHTAVKTGSTSVSVGGGMWQYGTSGSLTGTVYSNYHHGSKYHTATACNGAAFKTCKQVAAAAGSWANASTDKSLAGNTAYWNTL